MLRKEERWVPFLFFVSVTPLLVEPVLEFPVCGLLGSCWDVR